MTDRTLTVSFGGAHPAKITQVRRLTWSQFALGLTRRPKEADDKAAHGWYCPVEFDPAYRDSDNFVARHAITLDFDHIDVHTKQRIVDTLREHAYALYTTHSHTPEHPRYRVVVPLSRPACYDEFQAVVRKLAETIGIELVARESFVPSQMMYMPAVKPGGEFEAEINAGVWLDVDYVLNSYADWTDKSQWPKRKEGDGVHSADGLQTPPDEKPGIVGDFCRTFSVEDVIERFEIPYAPTATEGRWTYTNGSRPEGVILYDIGAHGGHLKCHSHHDTDPARGQHNAFDLVRLHRFGSLDADEEDRPVTERSSWKAMLEFCHGLAELQQATVEQDFTDLGPLVEEEVILNDDGTSTERFRVRPANEFTAGKPMEWIIRGVLPRAELCVLYGESGSGKSFLALDLCAAITRGIEWRSKRTARGSVVYVCAEGAGGFKARLRAYAQGRDCALHELPAVIPDAPNLLEAKDAAALAHGILAWGRPDVVVIDTLSATTPGGNENSGEDMGLVLSHCKFIHRKTGALVVLIHHSGKDATKGARGWSGLRAAADAEIEVVRNGDFRSATITKMKDGEDGSQLAFKLRTVALGFDADGEEESSCVVEHLDDVESPSARKARPSGEWQIKTLDVLREVAPTGVISERDLATAVLAQMPAQVDTRGQNRAPGSFDRALRQLCAKNLVFVHAGGVSLTAIKSAEDSEWL